MAGSRGSADRTRPAGGGASGRPDQRDASEGHRRGRAAVPRQRADRDTRGLDGRADVAGGPVADLPIHRCGHVPMHPDPRGDRPHVLDSGVRRGANLTAQEIATNADGSSLPAAAVDLTNTAADASADRLADAGSVGHRACRVVSAAAAARVGHRPSDFGPHRRRRDTYDNARNMDRRGADQLQLSVALLPADVRPDRRRHRPDDPAHERVRGRPHDHDGQGHEPRRRRHPRLQPPRDVPDRLLRPRPAAPDAHPRRQAAQDRSAAQAPGQRAVRRAASRRRSDHLGPRP